MDASGLELYYRQQLQVEITNHDVQQQAVQQHQQQLQPQEQQELLEEQRRQYHEVSQQYQVSIEQEMPGLRDPMDGGPTDPEKCCWICFATEEDNRQAEWVKPCQCRGSTKWVHQSCLYRWIDEKQMGNHRRSVMCQQCQTEYIIVFPEVGLLAGALERIDLTVRKTSPYLAAGIFTGSAYWTAITYGAITVVQVMGQKRGMELMEYGDPFMLLVGLPFIPVALVLFRFIRWQDAALRILRSRYNILHKLPFFKWIVEPDQSRQGSGASNLSLPPLPPTPAVSEPLYISRLFCGAVLLPTFATMTGNLFFNSLQDPLYRTLVGGIAFIGFKGLLKIYLRQKLYIRRRRRRIVDYTDENVRIYMGGEVREAPPVQDPRANPNPNRANPRQNAGHDQDPDGYAISDSSSLNSFDGDSLTTSEADEDIEADNGEIGINQNQHVDYRMHYLNAEVNFYSVHFPQPQILGGEMDMDLD